LKKKLIFFQNSKIQAAVASQQFPDSKGNSPETGFPWPQIYSNVFHHIDCKVLAFELTKILF